jgi:hypothetical protein
MIRYRLVVVAVALLGACGTSGKPPAPTPKAEQPFSLAGVFPPGPGRDLVLDACGSCHPVACSALGQRTAERWEVVKEGHKDKLTGRSSADVNAMFAYLKENFNDSKPEPKIPAEMAQQGCTPY